VLSCSAGHAHGVALSKRKTNLGSPLGEAYERDVVQVSNPVFSSNVGVLRAIRTGEPAGGWYVAGLFKVRPVYPVSLIS